MVKFYIVNDLGQKLNKFRNLPYSEIAVKGKKMAVYEQLNDQVPNVIIQVQTGLDYLAG
jgi:hypothetical protein